MKALFTYIAGTNTNNANGAITAVAKCIGAGSVRKCGIICIILHNLPQ